MKTENSGKKILRATLIGSAIMLLVAVLTGLLGISPKYKGFRIAMANYFKMWIPHQFPSIVSYVGVVIIVFALFLFLCGVIVSIKKKKVALLLNSLAVCLTMLFFPFLLVMIVPQVEAGTLGRLAFYSLVALSLINILAFIILMIPFVEVIGCIFGVIKRVAVGKEEPKAIEEVKPVEEEKPVEEVKEKDEEKPAEKEPVGLTEEEVRKIVCEEIEAHKEELHKEPAKVEEPAEEKEEEPVAEEAADEEAEDDEEEVEEVTTVDENGNTVVVKRKKRVPFERKLRNSEFDLRHKYYDLRDYIKWYGVNNRISIPGDTFSYKRKKLFFITIVGKHIKLYASIDPEKYAESTIPASRASAKKFVDVPCMLKIKSDLSYRRAKQIVDDVMAAEGMEKPFGEEPKETQHK